jgi:hypothetical protein
MLEPPFYSTLNLASSKHVRVYVKLNSVRPENWIGLLLHGLFHESQSNTNNNNNPLH